MGLENTGLNVWLGNQIRVDYFDLGTLKIRAVNLQKWNEIKLNNVVMILKHLKYPL